MNGSFNVFSGSAPYRPNALRAALGKLFVLRGSVFPLAGLIALPAACIAFMLKKKALQDISGTDWFGLRTGIMNNNAAFNGFSMAMGFLFVFRTSQAYSIFWEGKTLGHRMYAEWLDASSAVLAFANASKKDKDSISNFDHRFIRLMSLLHATALANLRHMDGSQFELIDIRGLSDESMTYLASCEHPVTLVFQWIMQLLVDNIDTGILSVPPPVLTRAFQELANGMVAYEDAKKIQTSDFPLPYFQATTLLLLFHYCFTPFVICDWTNHSGWVFVFTFIQIFIFWCLYLIALEIEHPFQNSSNCIKALDLQIEFNDQLVLLIGSHARKPPTLTLDAQMKPHLIRQVFNASRRPSLESSTRAQGVDKVPSITQRIFARRLSKESRSTVSSSKSNDFSTANSSTWLSQQVGVASVLGETNLPESSLGSLCNRITKSETSADLVGNQSVALSSSQRTKSYEQVVGQHSDTPLVGKMVLHWSDASPSSAHSDYTRNILTSGCGIRWECERSPDPMTAVRPPSQVPDTSLHEVEAAGSSKVDRKHLDAAKEIE